MGLCTSALGSCIRILTNDSLYMYGSLCVCLEVHVFLLYMYSCVYKYELYHIQTRDLGLSRSFGIHVESGLKAYLFAYVKGQLC
jgi:hypothetical protein